MKILFVNKFLYPRGGAETYFLQLSRELGARGHELQFFGRDEMPELFAEDHIAALKAYFSGVRYPLMQENRYGKANKFSCNGTFRKSVSFFFHNIDLMNNTGI